MTSIPAPICLSCKHLAKIGWTCEAFPGGIPDPIFESQADHRQPYEGDGGIVFEQAEGVLPPGEAVLEILDALPVASPG